MCSGNEVKVECSGNEVKVECSGNEVKVVYSGNEVKVVYSGNKVISPLSLWFSTRGVVLIMWGSQKGVGAGPCGRGDGT